ncbi:MAG: hypothetical protein A3F14_00860 [Gammaproteobacteria bacterium RIFCSPHIGHO2_12_FULL_43_28]|nr:MAG: hypothetical protein A3F14_00860 [Gammaproteobacteria bacterium RIFCSPHIGHO2_12_FULL_43_28]
MGFCSMFFNETSESRFVCELTTGILTKVFDRSDEAVNYYVDKALLLLLAAGIAGGAYVYQNRDHYSNKASHYRDKVGGIFRNALGYTDKNAPGPESQTPNMKKN